MKIHFNSPPETASDSQRRPRERWVRVVSVILAWVLMVGGVLFTSPGVTAKAESSTTSLAIAFTTIGIYPRSVPDMAGEKVGVALSDGTVVEVVCELLGAPVDNGSGANRIWERLSDGTYLPNAFLSTGTDSWTPGIARCDEPEPQTAAAAKFDRASAVTYAQSNWSANGRVAWLADCTWFASKSLWSGGLPQTTDWAESTTEAEKSIYSSMAWMGWPTDTAMAADLLTTYLVSSGLASMTPVDLDDLIVPGAEPGDLIAYEWGSNAGSELTGVIEHVAVVTETGGVQTLVTQHTTAQLDKGWNWSAESNDWINMANPDATAYLIHILY